MSAIYKSHEDEPVAETRNPDMGESSTIYLSSGELAKDSVPVDVDELTEKNDLTVLEGQLSSDELVSNMDIMKTEDLILSSRSEDDNDLLALTSQEYTIDIWSILKKGAINIILPFINGMMLGFGEILAHEIGFRYNWTGARVSPPRRMEQIKARTPSKFL